MNFGCNSLHTGWMSKMFPRTDDNDDDDDDAGESPVVMMKTTMMMKIMTWGG